MKKYFALLLIGLLALFTLTGCGGGNKLSTQELNELYAANDMPRHMVVIEVKQSHFSLDIGKHIKDSINKVEFAIPVDEIFYESIEVGDLLNDEFRVGSFITSGSVGSWNIKVTDKFTVEP